MATEDVFVRVCACVCWWWWGGVRGCVRVVCDSPSFPAPNGDSDDDDEDNERPG